VRVENACWELRRPIAGVENRCWELQRPIAGVENGCWELQRPIARVESGCWGLQRSSARVDPHAWNTLDGLGEQSCTHGVKFRQPGYRGRRRSWNHACRTKGSDQREPEWTESSLLDGVHVGPRPKGVNVGAVAPHWAGALPR
jgi:hypothetical protein